MKFINCYVQNIELWYFVDCIKNLSQQKHLEKYMKNYKKTFFSRAIFESFGQRGRIFGFGRNYLCLFRSYTIYLRSFILLGVHVHYLSWAKHNCISITNINFWKSTNLYWILFIKYSVSILEHFPDREVVLSRFILVWHIRKLGLELGDKLLFDQSSFAFTQQKCFKLWQQKDS